MKTIDIATRDGVESVECAGVFGVWAATKCAAVECVTTYCGAEIDRYRRKPRGWNITHVPTGTGMRLSISRPRAVKLAKALAERFPDVGALLTVADATMTPSPEQRAVGQALYEFIVGQGFVPVPATRIVRGRSRKARKAVA